MIVRRAAAADQGSMMVANGGAPRVDELVRVVDVSSEHRGESDWSAVALDPQLFLAQGCPGFVFGLDGDGAFLWVAPDVTDVLGWSPGDLVGMSVAELVHPQDRAAVREQWVREGRTHARPIGGVVVRMRNRTGAYRWMDWGQARASDTGAHPPGSVACLRDVDELMRARLQLEADRGRLEAALDALLEPHVVLDAVRDASGMIVDFVHVEANKAACEYNGMSHQDLIGARLSDVLPTLVASAVLELSRPVVETGEPLVLDDRPFGKELPGGEERFYDVRAVRVGDGLFLTWRDVTDRHRAAEAVAAAEARYRLLAENATDVVAWVSTDGVIVWVSRSVEWGLGWRPEQLIGTLAIDLVNPDDQPALLTSRAEMLAGVPVEAIEQRIRTADGRYRWMSCQARLTTGADGSVTGRVIGLRDVDQQVKDRQALAAQAESLERSEEHFRLLAENASDVVAQLTMDDTIRWVSPSAQSVLGWAPEQLVGTSVVDLTHPDDRESVDRWRIGMCAGSTSAPFEVRVLTGDGSYRWVSIYSRVARASDGSATGQVAALRDAQDQVLARQALVDSERRYRMLAENAADVVWHLDVATVLRWVTPSIESVLGWTPADLLGKPAIDLVHPEDLPVLLQWRDLAFTGAVVAPLELRLRTAHGDFRWMSLHARPTTALDGSVDGAVVGLRDVHEQVIARQNLARSEEMFRLAMDGAPQGMAVVGLHGRFLRVNDVLCQMVGRDPAWMRERTEYDVIHPDDLADDLAARDRLLAGDAEYVIHEGRLVSASGEQVWVQHSLALVRDEHQMPVFYVSQFQDITGARAAKQDLQYR
ncbi:MAG: PAS domain S-box protein, partial [Actinomycetes bacterium]